MKLITAEKLAEKIKGIKHVVRNIPCSSSHNVNYKVDSEYLVDVAQSILDIVKASAFDAEGTIENNTEIQRIAELEAKVFVYESFIKSAGFKLPKETKQKE